MRRRSPWAVAVTVVLAVVVLGLLALPFADPWHKDIPKPWPPTPAQLAGTERLALGVVTPALARNGYRPWTVKDLVEVNAFEQRVRHHADIISWFENWASRRGFDPRQATAVAERHSVPQITWEPWDPALGLRRAQPRYSLASITAGAHDAYIRRWAAGIAAYGGPVHLRFAHEPNGNAYPWSEGRFGNAPGDFVRAWRHIHRIFDQEGADNVTWVWSPVAGELGDRPGSLAATYPGARWVDIVGLTGFNGGTRVFSRRWRSFRSLFDPTLAHVAELAPGKPVQISEVASAAEGGDRAVWIRDALAAILAHPEIRGLIWFDVDKEADWRIEKSSADARAFSLGINRDER